jgi:GNAT superfamily N-acetyltransferase
MVLQIQQRADGLPGPSGALRPTRPIPAILTPIQKACPLRTIPPPGANVYTKAGYSLYEIDGEKHKLYAQNLSLFAKLFLDTKSVFYDVTTFLYYLLVAHHPTPSIANTDLNGEGAGAQGQVVGFFSKEKMSWDNNNLACILVFPPWQKQGLGQILMGASYEMSRREERLGGPEKRTSLPCMDVSARRDTDVSMQHCQNSVASLTNTIGLALSRAASSHVRLRRRSRLSISAIGRTLCPTTSLRRCKLWASWSIRREAVQKLL